MINEITSQLMNDYIYSYNKYCEHNYKVSQICDISFKLLCLQHKKAIETMVKNSTPKSVPIVQTSLHLNIFPLMDTWKIICRNEGKLESKESNENIIEGRGVINNL